MRRAVVDLRGVAEFNHLAVEYHRDPVRNAAHYRQVMCDEQVCGTDAAKIGIHRKQELAP